MPFFQRLLIIALKWHYKITYSPYKSGSPEDSRPKEEPKEPEGQRWLVVWNMVFMTVHILGIVNFNWLICFRGVETTNQYVLYIYIIIYCIYIYTHMILVTIKHVTVLVNSNLILTVNCLIADIDSLVSHPSLGALL